MSNRKRIFITIGVVLVSMLAGWFVRGLFGGHRGGSPMTGGMQMSPASVTVQTVMRSYLQPADEYIAKVEPVEDAMIRSEVPGIIETVHFTEGAMVRKGDLLFTIDPRSYQATADAAQADLLRAQRLYDRMKNADARSVSKSDLDNAESDLLRARAAFDLATVNLERTEIKAPVSGRIGSAMVTKGNYVTPASGTLARIVQMNPIRIVFSLSDREYFALRRKEQDGSGIRTAQVKLPDGTLLSTVGEKDFDDNAINPQTGTIAVRYLFDNTDGLLIPGGYVTALLRNPEAEKGIKIPQRALLVDQHGTAVLTVDENGVVSFRRISAGLQVGTDITVLSGLKEGERVVVDGVQKARPGATVTVIHTEER